eukprot:3305793-Alexandrium_andersonii.AAC.1
MPQTRRPAPRRPAPLSQQSPPCSSVRLTTPSRIQRCRGAGLRSSLRMPPALSTLCSSARQRSRGGSW